MHSDISLKKGALQNAVFAARPKSVILSERSEAPGSSHCRNIYSQIGAKILRLPPKIFDFLQSLRMTSFLDVLQFILQHAFFHFLSALLLLRIRVL